MFSHSKSPLSSSPSAGIALRDLLEDRHGFLSDYFSLSVTRLGEDVVISLTTTGRDPVTYSTVISSAANIDVQSLVFVAQHDRGEV